MDYQFYIDVVESLDLSEDERFVYHVMQNLGFLPHCIRLVILDYKESHRHWHTVVHIRQMLSLLDQHRSVCPNWRESQVLIIYHDLIYNVQCTLGATRLKLFNERCSAAVMKNHVITSGIAGFTEEVVDVMVSALLLSGHFPEECQETGTNTYRHALFLHDLDYAIFANDLGQYDEYSMNIAQEYMRHARITPFEFEEGRLEFLRDLQRRGVYKMRYFFDLWEEKALANIDREIKRLTWTK